MSRAVIDRNTYAIILHNQYLHYLKTEHFEDKAMLKARQSVASAFVIDYTLDDTTFQKDSNDARRDDEWTTN